MQIRMFDKLFNLDNKPRITLEKWIIVNDKSK